MGDDQQELSPQLLRAFKTVPGAERVYRLTGSVDAVLGWVINRYEEQLQFNVAERVHMHPVQYTPPMHDIPKKTSGTLNLREAVEFYTENIYRVLGVPEELIEGDVKYATSSASLRGVKEDEAVVDLRNIALEGPYCVEEWYDEVAPVTEEDMVLMKSTPLTEEGPILQTWLSKQGEDE